jgi:hypothetical protein
MRDAWRWFVNIGAFAASVAAIVWIADATHDIRASVSAQEKMIMAQEQQLRDLEQRVSELPVVRVPSGAEVLDVECLPVGERIRVEGNRAYDFCGTDVSIAIEQILSDTIDWGATRTTVPRTIQQGDRCALDLLSIDRSEPGNNRAEIRLRCS